MKQIMLVGAEEVAYTDKSGNPRHGVRIHVTETFSLVPGGPVVGERANNYYIANADISDYPLGELMTVLFEPTLSGKARCTGVLYKPVEKQSNK